MEIMKKSWFVESTTEVTAGLELCTGGNMEDLKREILHDEHVWVNNTLLNVILICFFYTT